MWSVDWHDGFVPWKIIDPPGRPRLTSSVDIVDTAAAAAPPMLNTATAPTTTTRRERLRARDGLLETSIGSSSITLLWSADTCRATRELFRLAARSFAT